MIMHIDMDAFFASIEQAVNPRLKGRPLIVGSRDKKFATVVCAASYEAKALGIDSGMSTQEAFKLCPEALFVPADSAKYIWTSEKIFQILKEYSPIVQYISVDEFDLELLGLEKLFGSYERLGQMAKERIKQDFGLTASIGIAKNHILAKLAAKLGKPDGLVHLRDEDLEKVLKEVAVEKLCGVGPSLKNAFSKMGIKTCLDLLNCPREVLTGTFGKIGLWLYGCLRYEDALPLTPGEEPPKSVGHSYTLPRKTNKSDVIFAWLRLLSEMVAHRLRSLNLAAKTVHLYMSSGQNFRLSKQKTFGQPTFDGHQIFARCQHIINQPKNMKLATPHPRGSLSVRALGVSCSSLRPPCQFLFGEKSVREELLYAIDSINHRFGEWTIFPATVKQIN